MTDRPPPINQVVGLLARHDPAALEELRERYGRHPDLEPGIHMGEGGARTRELRMRAEAAAKGLRAGAAVCESLIPKVKGRLRLANKLHLLSQAVTAVGSASIFGTLQISFPRSNGPTYAAATLTLVGALLLPLITHFRGGLMPGSSLFDVYKELVECRVEAGRTLAEIEVTFAKGSGGDPALAAELVRQANVICDRVARAENYL